MLQTVSWQILMDKVEELKYKLTEKDYVFLLKNEEGDDLLSTKDFQKVERFVDNMLKKKTIMRPEVVALMKKLKFSISKSNYDFFVEEYDNFMKTKFPKTKKWWGDYHFEITKKRIDWK